MFMRSVCLFAFFLLLTPSVPVLARTASEADLMRLFAFFIQGEEVIEQSAWLETNDWLAHLQTDYMKIRSSLSQDVPAQDTAKFEAALKSFEIAVAQRNHDRGHKQFLVMHSAFLDLLDNYDFKVPPLMYLVRHDLKETQAAILENDLREIEDELMEVESYYAKLSPLLLKKQVDPPSIQHIKTLAGKARSALLAKDIKTVATLTAQIQQLFNAQLKQIANH